MPKKRQPVKPVEVGWTVRMPASLAAQVRSRAAALTSRGEGKWTGNMVMVAVLRAAAATWEPEKAP